MPHPLFETVRQRRARKDDPGSRALFGRAKSAVSRTQTLAKELALPQKSIARSGSEAHLRRTHVQVSRPRAPVSLKNLLEGCWRVVGRLLTFCANASLTATQPAIPASTPTTPLGAIYPWPGARPLAPICPWSPLTANRRPPSAVRPGTIWV